VWISEETAIVFPSGIFRLVVIPAECLPSTTSWIFKYSYIFLTMEKYVGVIFDSSITWRILAEMQEAKACRTPTRVCFLF